MGLSARTRAGFAAATGTAAGASAVVALLALGCVFLSVALPRSGEAYRTKALQRLVAATLPTGRSVVASIDYTSLGDALGLSPGPSSRGITQRQIASSGAELARNLTAHGLPLQPAPDRWSGLTTGYTPVPGAARSAYYGQTPPQVEVVYRSRLAGHARLVAGVLPGGAGSGAGAVPSFQVAVTSVTARRFRLGAGSVLRLPGIARLVVTGIVRPADPGSAFWTADPDAAAPTFNFTRGAGQWLGAVFAGGSELPRLEDTMDSGQMTLTWQFPLRLAGLRASQAGRLSSELGGALASAGLLRQSVGYPTSVALTCGLTGALTGFLTAEHRIGALLGLLEVSLAVVGAVVLLLGGRLLAERRQAEFALMRARGASRRQLAWLCLRAGAVAVLPAAAAGAAAAVAVTPGGAVAAAWWLGGLTVAAALAGPPAFTIALTGAMGTGQRRPDDPPPRQARARRAVADVTMVLAAAGGIAVLREAAAGSGSSDWYPSAAPVLVAVPVAIAVVRAYPVLVRWLAGLAARRPGAAVFLGLARAARTSPGTVLPILALVLAGAVIAFGATIRTAVLRGDVAASWRAVGADAVIDASGSSVPVGTAARNAIARVPGVTAVTAVGLQPGVTTDGAVVGVVTVEPAGYAALTARTPLPAFPAAALAEPAGWSPASPVPVLATRQAAAAIGRSGRVLDGITSVRVRVAGVVAGAPGTGASGPLVVAPAWAMNRVLGAAAARPDRLLVAGPGIPAARMRAVARRVLPGSAVTLRSARLAARTGAPLPRGAYAEFAQGAAAAGCLAAVIAAIMLALGARARELTLARLLTMGLSATQARGLLITEVLPSVTAAAAGGAACAWALVPLLAPAISLEPLTGSSAPVPVSADVAVLGYLAVALLAITVAVLLAQAAATRLRGVTRALRVGE